MLIDHQQTNGGMALLEMVLPKGAEPPPHIHVNEDESFYLREGPFNFNGRKDNQSQAELTPCIICSQGYTPF